MNFKKIMTGVLAGAMAVSAMAVSAFADDAKTDLELKLVIMVDGMHPDYPMSDAVKIDKDGEYTFKIDNVDVSKSSLQTLYIKDAYAIEKDLNGEALDDYKSPVAEGFSVTGITLKINGNDVAIDDAFLTESNKTFADKGVFDYCLYNIWATNYIEIADGTTINSVEIKLTVTGSGNEGEPAAPGTEGSSAEASSTEASSPVGDPGATTPDKNQPNTGVESVAVVAALAIVATGAVVIAKKRK